MSGVAVAIGVGTVAAGAISARAQKKAAGKAAKAQMQGDQAAIDEQKRQFDEVQKLLKPYIDRGTEATDAERAFLGLAGPQAEREAIANLQNSESFKAAAKEGENAILQNAAATGGLRGGNVQASLAKFRPNLLAQAIAQRFAGLDALAQRGQASAAGQAAAGQNSANAIAGLLQDQGAAQAGAALARGNAQAGFVNTIAQAGGTLAGYYANRPTTVSPAADVFNASIAASNAAAAPPQYGVPAGPGTR